MQTGKKCQGSAYIFFTVTKEYIIVHFTSSHAGNKGVWSCLAAEK